MVVAEVVEVLVDPNFQMEVVVHVSPHLTVEIAKLLVDLVEVVLDLVPVRMEELL